MTRDNGYLLLHFVTQTKHLKYEAQLQKTPSQDMKPEQLEKMAKTEGWLHHHEWGVL